MHICLNKLCQAITGTSADLSIWPFADNFHWNFIRNNSKIFFENAVCKMAAICLGHTQCVREKLESMYIQNRRPSQVFNRNSYTQKTVSSLWIEAQDLMWLFRCHPNISKEYGWIYLLNILGPADTCTRISLCMRPSNERRRYIVTSSLIDWVHIQMISAYISSTNQSTTKQCVYSKGFVVYVYVIAYI